MKQKVKYILITSALVLATFCFLSPRTIAGYPDRWVRASSYNITIGSHHSGTISDTYTNNGQYLVGKCRFIFIIFDPWYYNDFSIKFDFSNSHYKNVRVEATTDPLGLDGSFCVDAVYTSGSPKRVRLGCFNPGSAYHTFTVDRTKNLDKIIVEYLQVGAPGQRRIYIDWITALWTSYP